MLLIAISLFAGWVLHAQSIPSVKYGVADGLPSEEIYDLCRDSTGYIWVGTEAGLVRFDGITFRQFDNQLARGLGFTNLRTDVYGRVWTQNFRGQLFYVENDSLHLAHDFGKLTNRFTPFEIGNEALYFGSKQDRIYRIDLNSLQCDTMTISATEMISKWKKALPRSTVVEVDRALDFLVVADVFPSGEIHVLTHRTSSLVSPDGTVRPFVEDSSPDPWATVFRNGSFFVETKSSRLGGQTNLPIRFAVQGLKVEPPKDWQPDLIFRVEALDKNRIFLASDRGALIVSKRSGFSLKQQILLPNQETNAAVLDSEGGLWLSSLYGGLYYFPNTQAISTPIADELLGNLISGSVDSKGRIWLGSYGGTCLRINEDSGLEKILIPGSYTLRAFRFDDKNRTWIISGNGRGYIDSLDIFHRVEMLGLRGESEYIRDLISLGNDRYLVGIDTYLGLFRLVGNRLELEHVVSTDATQSMYPDDIGGAYVNLVNGLFHCKLKGAESLCTPVRLGEQQILATAFAHDTSTKMPRTVYARTQHQGLVSLRSGVASVPFEIASKVLPGTDLLFHKDTLYYSDGRRIQQISTVSGHRSSFCESGSMPEGQLIGLFATENLLISASGKELVKQPFRALKEASLPQFVNLEIEVDGDFLDSIPDRITLDGNTSTLTIHGDILHFSSGGKQLLNWHLFAEGDTLVNSIFQSWRSSKAGLSLTNLAHGDYTFLGVPTAADGSQGESFKVKITVSKPYYLQPWFILGSGFILMLASYGVFQRISRRQRHQEQLEKRLLSLEQSALKARLNPHFLFNTLNGIQSLVISGDKVKTSNYVERFSSLMREVLRASGEQWVTLEREFALLRVYLELEQLRFSDSFEFEIILDFEEHPSNSIIIPSMLLQPFVENAIIHGLAHRPGNRMLHLSAKQIPTGKLEVVVKDNGIGRVAANKINSKRRILGGFGTDSVSQRIKLLNAVHGVKISTQTIDLEEGGTCVIIRMPLLTDKVALELSSYEFK